MAKIVKLDPIGQETAVPNQRQLVVWAIAK